MRNALRTGPANGNIGPAMRISVLNRQKCLRLQPDFLRKLSAFFASLPGLSGRLPPSLAIVLVDHRGMIRLQANARDEQDATDVLCFPYRRVPGEPPDEATADIIINVERAAAVAARSGTGAIREIALYLAHALDHLGGGRDSSPAGRRLMRSRELRWLRKACRAGLLQDRDRR